MRKGVVIGGLIIVIVGLLFTVGIASSPTVRTRKVPLKSKLRKRSKFHMKRSRQKSSPCARELYKGVETATLQKLAKLIHLAALLLQTKVYLFWKR